ncbi:MAG TPA: NAD(P)-dependent oxidoreductase [Solirubrobacteraceae bacterium]|nr:NAD(P)-dependent oxidoreductase [Solirubrobacteraceae bacterium]
MAREETIAVLGAGGTMGLAIARNLARAGHEVRGWNRSREKAEPLADDGVMITDTPAQAAQGATVILSMLADGEAVLGSMRGENGALAGARGEDVVWLQMSTIGEVATEECIDLAREHGLAFVDAPVLGTKGPAEQGKLVIMASGPERLRERLAPIFDVIGQRTMWVGEAGAGTKLKIAANSWIITVVEGAAETFALAEGIGIDPQLVLDAIAGGPLDLPYLHTKGEAIMQRRFDPSFKLALAAKDAALVEEAAARHGLDLPMLATIRRRLEEGVPEHGDEDVSATYLTSAPDRTAA